MLHRNEGVKEKPLQNKKQTLWGSGDGGANAQRGEGGLQADDKGVLGGSYATALRNTFSDESRGLEGSTGGKRNGDCLIYLTVMRIVL